METKAPKGKHWTAFTPLNDDILYLGYVKFLEVEVPILEMNIQLLPSKGVLNLQMQMRKL